MSESGQKLKKEFKASEVAKRFDVNPYTVKAWIKAGHFPNARLEESIIGKVWLIPESDLENFQKPEKGRPKKKAEK